jgi:hypothetical protein
MRKNLASVAVLFFSVFVMIGCSEPAKTVQASNEHSISPEPVLAKTAFWAAYKTAYSWSNDALPLKLESKSVSGIKNQEGRAAMWTATFGSVRRKQALEISYAVVARAPDVVKGIKISNPVPWSGPTREVMSFQGSEIVDSDAAYKKAAAEAQSWLKAHPDKEVSFLLGNNPTAFASPVWYVVWGDKKAGYRSFVNAKTGDLAKPLK